VGAKSPTFFIYTEYILWEPERCCG